MANQQETYAIRIDKCERYERMVSVVAAALLGQVACIAAGATDHAPYPFTPVAFTLILVASLCLGQARIGFDWLATRLRRDLMAGSAAETSPVPQGTEYRRSNKLYSTGLLLTLLGGLTVAVGAWFPSP